MDVQLTDGFPTILVLGDPTEDIFGELLLEKRVKPPGFIGGGAIDISTMRNNGFRTKWRKKLLDTTPCTATCAFATDAYIGAAANIQTVVISAVVFGDNSAFEFWAFMDEFDPQEEREGDQPEANVTLIPTNCSDAGVEVAPSIVDDYFS